jgi:ATP-dependent Lon protease
LTVQLRAFDAARSGGGLGLPALLAFCGALLGKSLKGGLVAVGGLNLGGGFDPVYNAVGIAELAIEKGAETLLIPVSARRQLNELSDDMATKISVLYYADAREALLKALVD